MAPVRSLRVKVLLVVAVVALAPQIFVLLWSLMERNIAGEMKVRTAWVASEMALRLAASGALDADTAASMEQMARVHGLRLRVVRNGIALLDADEDSGTDLVHQIGMLFFGPDGAPSLEEFDRGLGPLAARPEIAQALAHGTSSDCRTSTGGKLLVCHGARTVRGTDGGDTVIYAQESSRRAVRALYDLRYQLARISVITLPLALALGYWMGRRVVRPIEELRRQALDRAGSGGPLGPVAKGPELAVRGQDEITDLAEAFNTLLAKLDHRQGENERFVADLVHELKNPVAAVRAAAERLADGPVDEARARRLGRVLLDSSARLDGLVSQFLELARAEAGLVSDERALVDVGAAARGLAEGMRARFEAVEIEVSVSGDTRVRAVPHGIDTILRNLVENACSFAAAGEPRPRVEVEIEGGEAQVTIRVTDSGPGIAPEDRARVFDRFFTKRGDGRGTGLGLSLVRATAVAHGGAVRVVLGPARGATFEVALPVVDRADTVAGSQ